MPDLLRAARDGAAEGRLYPERLRSLVWIGGSARPALTDTAANSTAESAAGPTAGPATGPAAGW